MAQARGAKPVKMKVQEHRDRLRAQGLRPIRLMVDKLATVPKSKIGERIGRLDDEDVVRHQSGDAGVSRLGRVAENGPERGAITAAIRARRVELADGVSTQ